MKDSFIPVDGMKAESMTISYCVGICFIPSFLLCDIQSSGANIGGAETQSVGLFFFHNGLKVC